MTNLVEEMFPGGKFNLPAFEQAVEKHLAQLNDPAKVREAVQKILEHARPAVSPAEQAEIDKAIEKIGQIERVWKELAALSQSDLADPTRLEALLREALVRNRDMNSIVLKHLFADYLRSRGVPAATVDAATAKL